MPAEAGGLHALRAGIALPPQAPALELLRVTGADRVRFLNGMLVSDLSRWAPGQGGRSALLTAKGQVVSDLWAFIRTDDVLLVLPAGQGAPVGAALGRHAIMDDVALGPMPDHGPLTVLGPGAAAALEAAGCAGAAALSRQPPWSHGEADGLWLARVRALGSDGFWLAGSATRRAALEADLAAAGAVRLDDETAEAARVAAREPRWGAEIGPDYFPMEVGLGSAIDYGKGCYLGQEPIVRVRDRGHLNWRLCALRLGEGLTPERGDPLESDAKPRAGRITSAARLPDGEVIALALVHVSQPVGAPVRVRHGDVVIAATVEAEV